MEFVYKYVVLFQVVFFLYSYVWGGVVSDFNQWDLGGAVVFTGMSIISSLAAEAHDYFRHVKPLGADSW